MDSVVMTILMLSSISVTMEQQKEAVGGTLFPDVPPTFRRIQKVEETQRGDNSVLWQPTDAPPNDTAPPVVDGNSPDNHQITTHEHVDQTVGHVPPTKRVKKILPPFEGMLAGDKTTERDLSPPAETSAPEEATAYAPTPPKLEEEIQGIRLVPNESGLLLADEGSRRDGEEGEEEGEGLTMQKSIWDLLRGKSRFTAEPTHLDAVESSGNETDATSRRAKSLYEHFDADSAEVEFEMGKLNGRSNVEKHELPISYAMPWLQVRDEEFDEREPEASTVGWDILQDLSKLLKLSRNEKSVNGVSVSVIGDDYQKYGRRPSKWYLLLLTGNSTIVELRRKDFTKYLKLNLAARLSVEYDDVKVNKVILAPPKVLVNISVFAPSDDVAEESELDFKVSDKGEVLLYKLAETNATLLELSGEEYRVIRFLPFESQKPEAEAHKDIPTTVSMASRQNDLEFILYTLLGSACACAALLTFFLTLNRYYKRVSDFAWFKPKQMAWRVHEESDRDKDEFDGVSPAVIYSGGFPQIRGSWMTGVGRQGLTPLRRHWPGIEFGGALPRPPVPDHSHAEGRACTSPRHSKLQMYNCDANSVVIPMPVGTKTPARGKGCVGSNTHLLEVELPTEERAFSRRRLAGPSRDKLTMRTTVTLRSDPFSYVQH